MSQVFVTRALPAGLLEPLDRFNTSVWERDEPIPKPELLDRAADADGLLCMLTDSIDRDLLDRAPKLRVVSQMAVGVDNIDLDACAERGISVGHTPDVLTETTADHAFGLLGAVVRRIPEGQSEVLRGEWGPWAPFHLTGGDLHGTTLGIVGMGRIGQAIARRASGFDMTVVYTSRSPVPGVDARRLSLMELLEVSDHVVVSVALTEETRGLIGSAELAAMKTSAYLVNVARGPVVDTSALVRALSEGEIAGAGLDVTDPEPLPADHPLLDLPNCLVVPHLGSASVATRNAMARLAVSNLVAGLDGSPMPARHPDGG